MWIIDEQKRARSSRAAKCENRKKKSTLKLKLFNFLAMTMVKLTVFTALAAEVAWSTAIHQPPQYREEINTVGVRGWVKKSEKKWTEATDVRSLVQSMNHTQFQGGDNIIFMLCASIDKRTG